MLAVYLDFSVRPNASVYKTKILFHCTHLAKKEFLKRKLHKGKIFSAK